MQSMILMEKSSIRWLIVDVKLNSVNIYDVDGITRMQRWDTFVEISVTGSSNVFLLYIYSEATFVGKDKMAICRFKDKEHQMTWGYRENLVRT